MTDKPMRNCAGCGEPFEVTRANKTYCTTTCKSKHHHAADARTVRVRAAKQAISVFLDTATDDEFDRLSELFKQFARERKARR